VEVRFATSQLQKTLSGSSALRKRYGDIGARRIRTRLSQLEAADFLADLRSLPGRWHELTGDRYASSASTTHTSRLPGRWHELTGDRAGHLGADLHQPFRMILCPAEPVPRTDDGGLDWSRVTTVIITEIVDYH